jgi:TolB-like protein/DNA-binding winged helix-turn-helix (wHTH) protein
MQASEQSLTFGCFRLDRSRRRLFANGKAVALQGRPFDILEFLLDHRERPVTRDEIVEAVWRGVNVTDNNLAVQMSLLRRILAQYGGSDLIITVPHRGYRFVGEIDIVPDSAEALAPPPAPALLPAPAAGAPDLHRRTTASRYRRAAAIAASAVLAAGFFAWQAAGPTIRQEKVLAPDAFNPPADSVAVLAFTNLSGDPGQDYLSDGLSEELIEALSQYRQIQVTARTSSFFFKGKPATINAIAKALNVATVVEGSLRRQGTHLRIVARLTDARTGFEIWSHPFDSELGDMLKLEGDIASAVAEALQVKLAAGDTPDFAAGGTSNPEALDAYLRGIKRIRDFSLLDFKSALADFTRATELDPKFAFAYAGKASALINTAMFGQSSDTARIPGLESDALDNANRAVTLAPRLGNTHIARAYVLHGMLKMRDAWAEAQQALALTPGDATLELLFGTIAMAAGHQNQAIDALKRSVALDPLRGDTWTALCFTLVDGRHYEEAADACRHTQVLFGPQAPFIASELGLIFILNGQPQRANDICAGDSEWDLLQCRAIAEHALGHGAEATQLLQKARLIMGDNGAYQYAETYAQWGQKDDALQWLARAASLRDSGLTQLRNDPLLDPIRQEPRFKAIEQSLDFPE